MEKIILATHLEKEQPLQHKYKNYKRTRFSYLEDKNLILIVYTSRSTLTGSITHLKDINLNHNHGHRYNCKNFSDNNTHHFLK